MLEGTHTGILGRTENGHGEEVHLDLSALIGSHACIVANSGGGKSGLIRRLLETTYGRIQHIVLDGEDEFYTLRERYEYVIAGGEGGDVPAKVTNAASLAIGALTHGFSLVAQLNDLGHDGAPEFIGEFLTALVDAPRSLWHPVLVVIDETQRFAPRIGSTSATDGIKALLSRGRKRGFTAILAGTKLTEIDPSVRGGVNNWMLGRVGQALDRNTMADALGFTPKEGRDKLRALPMRQFWAFGPALSEEPILFRVSDVETTPIRAGQAKVPTPPAPEALRAILAGFAKAEPEAEVAASTAVRPGKGPPLLVVDAQNDALVGEVRDLQSKCAGLEQLVTAAEEQREQMRAAGLSAAMRIRAAAGDLEERLEQIFPLRIPVLSPDAEIQMLPVADEPPPRGRRQRGARPSIGKTTVALSVAAAADPPPPGDGRLGATAQAFANMLDRIAPAEVTWVQLAGLTNRKPRGGNFNTARRQLRESGLVIDKGERIRSAKAARGLTRAAAIDLWRSILPTRAAELLDVLVNAVNPMTRDDLGDAVGIKTVGGNWNTVWAALRNNGLIENCEGGGYQIARKLPGER